VAGYKINLQKSLVLIYTDDEQIEKEYRKTIPFTIASKKIEYLRVNLTKDVSVKKEIEENYRRWKDLP
jgi:hypothetical protein